MPVDMDSTSWLLRNLLTVAWLLPLVAFLANLFAVCCWSHRLSRWPGFVSAGAMGLSFFLSLIALSNWPGSPSDIASPPAISSHLTATDGHEAEGMHSPARAYAGRYYTLARFGETRIELSWYIDSLTISLFLVITSIALAIQIYAIGYLSDELTEDYLEEQVRSHSREPIRRAGRFSVFFAEISLFCFAMLGLILAGNLLQVFVFWELVGFCSYLLIGFYYERTSASAAANKAFLTNRVGDVGFLIGMMIFWHAVGTLEFGDRQFTDGHQRLGLLSSVQDADAGLNLSSDRRSLVLQGDFSSDSTTNPASRELSYSLWILGGLGLVAGCFGKSAQFPFQTWLPDAMAGPTPVSALVHSATMVAAGVYLLARCYPLFAPEVLQVVAYLGGLTLLMGASMALVAKDLKQILAFSTISQLGYMMLALGVGGWNAGVFHLATHAYFKSLLFLGAGSVILACHHAQDLREMGGLLKKLPWTAGLMLVGVLAITGLGVPNPVDAGYSLAFSGYHSKDSILATALAFAQANPSHLLLFLMPLLGAGLTAFYMFRLWICVFLGAPHDDEHLDQVQENSWLLIGPMLFLALVAGFGAIGGEAGSLHGILTEPEPISLSETRGHTGLWPSVWPGHDKIHAAHAFAGGLTWVVAIIGAGLAVAIYAFGRISRADLEQFAPWTRRFLLNRWEFDAIYHTIFVQPVRQLSEACQQIDRHVIDPALLGLGRGLRGLAAWERKFDEYVVDGIVEQIGRTAWTSGESLRKVQTGQLRQYVLWLGVSVVILFVAFLLAAPR